MDRCYPDVPEEDDPEEEGTRQHLDTTTVHLLVFNTHFYTRMVYVLLADSSVDRKGKRAGRVELQEVEVLPVHLPAGLVVGKCHLP